MIDCISGGRLVAGFPVGTSMDTAYAYSVNPGSLRDKYYEGIELIRILDGLVLRHLGRGDVPPRAVDGVGVLEVLLVNLVDKPLIGAERGRGIRTLAGLLIGRDV